MFKFFWVSHKRSEMFSYFNSYQNFKSKKSKKFFVINEVFTKNFYNFKKYDVNLKNGISSRDVVIQYLFDSKFSTFVIFIKLTSYLLLLAYMFVFILYVICNSAFIIKLLLTLLICSLLYVIFVMLFIVNLTLFSIICLFLILVSSNLYIFFFILTLVVLDLKLAIMLFFVFFFMYKTSILFLFAFVFLKLLLLYLYVYVLSLDHILTLMGFRVNASLIANFTFLSKKINFFFYIFINQSLNKCGDFALFFYFFKSTFFFFICVFKIFIL